MKLFKNLNKERKKSERAVKNKLKKIYICEVYDKSSGRLFWKAKYSDYDTALFETRNAYKMIKEDYDKGIDYIDLRYRIEEI